MFRTTDTRNAQPNSKRMKNGQPNINYLLEDEEIAEDLKTIQKTTGSVSSRPSSSATSAAGGGSGAVFSPSGAPSSSSSSTSVAPVSLSGIRIENGKLFYDKKWFHRGQPVFLETPHNGGRDAGVIMAIGGHQDTICVRKIEDRTKTKIHLAQLTKQKFVLRKRTT